MKKKSIILVISLIFIVLLSSGVAFAEDSSDMQMSNNNEIEVQESNDVATLNDNNDENIQSSPHTIAAGSTSQQIQDEINSMEDGDVLNFETGEYTDICIYVNKSITINGNGATLIGYETPSKANTPSIITNTTADGGYGIGNLATFYIIKASNVVVNGLTIVGGAHSGSSTAGPAYSNALVYVESSNNLTFTNNKLEGSSWGLYLRFSHDGQIVENNFKNQEVTGILNFGSARTLIARNNVTNAKNHGIDVRHGTGPNVQVINNTVTGSKEGIYLMHSKGHTASGNTLIKCNISSISCYGSSNIILKDNKLIKSRIGFLLGGGYSNITIGENEFNLDNLPFPPTFVYYVAEGKTYDQGAAEMMGTHSDSEYTPDYIAYSEISKPDEIHIDYNNILQPTGTVYDVPERATSANIQTIINSMNDGDTLRFAENAVYNDICIYTDKNIRIIGNNATLVGLNNVDLNNIPSKVRSVTADGGYGIVNPAVLYLINNTNVVVSNLNIKSQYPDFDNTKVTPTTTAYKTAGIFTDNSKNVTITGCSIDGASWGLYIQYSGPAKITNNNIKNQFTTGILNFGSPNSILANNTITDAVNHGIDVRHGTGPNVTVFNNTISGSKEGIYLMHSKGHKVYNNTIENSKISGITCYGSGNETLFNNTISGSRIGILLGGGYYNVTIGTNTYNLDFLPFPPTFVTYLAKADSKYDTASETIGTYYDKEPVTINAEDLKTGNETVTYEFTLTDSHNNGVSDQPVKVKIGEDTYNSTTDAEGKAVVTANLAKGKYAVTITYAGTERLYSSASKKTTIQIGDPIASKITITMLDGLNLTGILKDSDGDAIANAIVFYTLNEGNKSNVTTNDAGEFTITAANNCVLEMIYKGTDMINGTTCSITLKNILPVQKDTIIVVEKAFKRNAVDYNAGERGYKFYFTLTDSDGKVLAEKPVKIGVDGKIYNVKTDKDGKAGLMINLATANFYTYGISFLGDDEYKASFAVSRLNVVKKATTITPAKTSYTFKASAKTKTITATLKSTNNYIPSGKQVTLTIGDKTFKATIGAKGQINLNIGSFVKKGTYKVTIKFAGTGTYAASTSKTISVKIS